MSHGLTRREKTITFGADGCAKVERRLSGSAQGRAMGRKIFKDFAYVLPQMFLQGPTNRDLVNLVLLGDGTLTLDILARRARHGRLPVTPLPYADRARAWLETRLSVHRIPSDQLVRAVLTVEYTVVLARGPVLMGATYMFRCTGLIEAPDRRYVATLSAEKKWGLGQV
jgi:hypothetical protein